MKALVFRAGENPVVEEIDGFQGIKRVVGGHIRRIILDRGIALWCDEDGISKGLPANLFAIGPTYLGARVLGTAVLNRFKRVATEEGDHDEIEVDLTTEDVLTWIGMGRFTY